MECSPSDLGGGYVGCTCVNIHCLYNSDLCTFMYINISIKLFSSFSLSRHFFSNYNRKRKTVLGKGKNMIYQVSANDSGGTPHFHPCTPSPGKRSP